MLHVAALAKQRELRDLQELPGLVDAVDWLGIEGLKRSPRPAIVSALWVSEAPDQARELLRARSRSGGATLLVPRFRSGDLSGAIGASVPVSIRVAETRGVIWNDGEEYLVSAVTRIDTDLHAGQLARTRAGSAVLAFRPHASAAPIVLCTATLTNRSIGVEPAEQARFFHRILAETAPVSHSPRQEDNVGQGQATSPTAFLEENGAPGAILLLTLVSTGGDRTRDLEREARDRLGVRFDTGHAFSLLRQLPEATVDEIAAALQQTGWGAHLRRVLASGDSP